MRDAVDELDAYMQAKYPHNVASLFRVDALTQGYLAVYRCRPKDRELWAPEFRVVYWHQPTRRVIHDVICA